MAKRPTRADRFRVIRDAIMSQAHRMSPDIELRLPGFWRMRVGPFGIMYGEPGACGGDPRTGKLRGENLQIWPGARVDAWGHMLHNDKVANVDWDYADNICILSFRGGPWEAELLELLNPVTNVRAFS